jgi:hypothetical protein
MKKIKILIGSSPVLTDCKKNKIQDPFPKFGENCPTLV